VSDANGCTVSQVVTITEPPALVGNIIPTDVTCNGNDDGSILFNITGGTGSLTYSIDGINFQSSNLFSNLAPGTYNTVATDANGCSFNLQVVINEPTLLTVVGLATDEQYGND